MANEARRNNRSMNAEILARVESSFGSAPEASLLKVYLGNSDEFNGAVLQRLSDSALNELEDALQSTLEEWDAKIAERKSKLALINQALSSSTGKQESRKQAKGKR